MTRRLRAELAGLLLLVGTLLGCAAGGARVTADSCEIHAVAVGASEVCAYRDGSEASSTEGGATAAKQPCACVRGGHGSEPFWTMVGGAVASAGAWVMRVWK